MADGTKHDAGKPRMDLIPPRAEMLLAEVLTFGANRYGDDNWRDVPNMEQFEHALSLMPEWARLYASGSGEQE